MHKLTNNHRPSRRSVRYLTVGCSLVAAGSVATGLLLSDGNGSARASSVQPTAPAATTTSSPPAVPASVPTLAASVVQAVNSQGNGNNLAAPPSSAAATATVGQVTAEATALAGFPSGSQVMGTSLETFTSSLYPHGVLVWAIEVDPAGGIPSFGQPLGYTGTIAPQNYMVEFINAVTGADLGGTSGTSASLPALAPIRS